MTITLEIDKAQDLPEMLSQLDKLGWKYHVNEEELEGEDDDDWGDLSEAEIEGIKAGLADEAAGRLIPHEVVMQRIQNRLDNWRKKNG